MQNVFQTAFGRTKLQLKIRNYFFWIKKNKIEVITLLSILLVAAFLRLYRIDQYMTFLGDEGRDALMIKRILVEHDFPLLGPPTSIGNIYLGPLYYYMMAVPMAIFWLNPAAAAAQVALIGLATVGLIYFLARQWFGKLAATTSSILYALSPVNIIHSRSSWNPNPAPFFALLAILGLYKVHQTGNFLWFILTGGAVAFAIQMHYLALILLPVVGLIWLHEVIFTKVKKNLIKGTLLGAVIFLILMSPLVIFDLKHNFLNYRAITAFFTERETTVNLNPLNTLIRVLPIYSHDLLGRYMTGENPWLTPVMSIILLWPIIWVIRQRLKGVVKWSLLTLSVWLIVGVGGLALYKQTIYDHYLGFLNPAPFLLLGGVVKLIRGRILIITLIIFIIVIIMINLQNSPLQNPPNNQLKRTQEIAKFVIFQVGDQPFNFALIAKSNYDGAYQFYLDLYGHKPKQLPFEITDQLFVVCEDLVCQPVGHPKYEIAAFGWTKIEQQSEFAGVKVFKLVHNLEGK